MHVRTVDIARELDSVQQMSPKSLMTGWFSQMDEAVMKLLQAYPQLRLAHSKFSEARQSIGPSRLTDASWNTMKQAASELAVAVRSLGAIKIELCERRTKYGSCGHALLPSGECAVTWTDWHADS